MENQVIDIQKLNNQLTILNSLNRYPKMHYAVVVREGQLMIAHKSIDSDSGSYFELTNKNLNEWFKHELNELTKLFNQ